MLVETGLPLPSEILHHSPIGLPTGGAGQVSVCADFSWWGSATQGLGGGIQRVFHSMAATVFSLQRPSSSLMNLHSCSPHNFDPVPH